MKKTLKAIALSALITAGLSAKAQKLNTVQEASIWAPANVKVDAKLTEWKPFETYNKTVDVYYTMANDDANLYVVMKADNKAVSNKILGGGINITINTDSKKKEKDAFVITFPVVNLANLREQMMQGMRSARAQNGAGGMPDSATISMMRKKAVSTAKEIKLIGFKDIPDSVISIYNEYGIKSQLDFDNKGSIVVEMAIPLKYMHMQGGSSFAYDIKLNGIQIGNFMRDGGGMRPGGGPPTGGGSFDGGGMPNGGGGGVGFGGGGMGFSPANMPPGMADLMSMLTPTDFWGKYTLAKKP